MDDIAAKESDIKAFELPRLITFAILPNTDFSTLYSYQAAAQNREVMLHMPMESLNGKRLGPNPLLASMYPHQIAASLSLALSSVPHAVGVNNHMGSKLTQITLPMQSLMEVLAESNLFFIDSRTTKFSKASKIASEFGVSHGIRQVFLDHEKSQAFLENQMQELIHSARIHGTAIGIAHPYKITLDVLPALIDNLPNDIELVTVSNVLNETDKFRVRPKINYSQFASANQIGFEVVE